VTTTFFSGQSSLLPTAKNSEFNFGHMWEGCFLFDSTKHNRLSPGTLVSSCSNAGSISDGPH
jgi:hypothetical protein